MLAWVKVAVGVPVSVTFAFPLITIWKFKRLWDEPMAVLVASMAGFNFLLAFLLTSVGVLEIALGYVPFCTAFQYLLVASAGAVKVATLGLAVDQLTAVTSPLRYYCLMERRLPWLIAAGWLQFFQLTGVGGAFHAAGALTWSDFSHPDENGTALFAGCRWESRLSSTHMFLFEGEVFLSSLAISLLLLYTASVGSRTSRALRRRKQCGVQTGSEHDRFIANFRDFKKILQLLSLSLVLDVTSPVLRLYQRWYAIPTIAGVLQVLRLGCTILEGSTYGLMNRSLRKAYRDLLGLRDKRVRQAPQVKTITVRTAIAE